MLNTIVALGVKPSMKPAHVLVVAFAVLLAACSPASQRPTSRPTEPPRPGADAQSVRRTTRNMASIVADLQATSGGDRSGAGRSAGDLWIEVNRLKRGGQNVKSIEWQVSELEESLRGGQQDAVARRHILNNLSYEIETLNRRNR